jgi:hypothetical protein
MIKVSFLYRITSYHCSKVFTFYLIHYNINNSLKAKQPMDK